MLESLRAKWLTHHPLIAFVIGAVYPVLGFAIAWLFFRNSPSVPMLFLISLLLMPSLMKVLHWEEKHERKFGLRHFFHNHSRIIEIYLFLFLGIFTSYLVLGSISRIPVFEHQMNVLQDEQGLSIPGINAFLDSTFTPTTSQFLAVLESNLLTLLLLFGLSFFYGAGAIFLIVLNASVFAAFVLYVLDAIAKIGTIWSVLGVFMIHTLPEITGFLLAAIAGGVVSQAIVHEKFRSQAFKNVVRDALVLVVIACAFIVVGAALEVYVTTQVFRGVF